jgi:hypothetical protein
VTSSERRRGALWWVAALGLVLTAVWARAWVSARDELAQARALEASGQVAQAVEHYQWAARWYTPAASAPREALDALAALGGTAEASGDRAGALRAYRRLRGAVLATRHLWVPYDAHLAPTNLALSRLNAAQQMESGGPTIAGRSMAELEADHLALLELDPMPSPGWSLLVVLSFLGWIGGGFVTIARGLDAEARLVRPAFLRYGGLTALCFALWVLSLAYA